MAGQLSLGSSPPPLPQPQAQGPGRWGERHGGGPGAGSDGKVGRLLSVWYLSLPCLHLSTFLSPLICLPSPGCSLSLPVPTLPELTSLNFLQKLQKKIYQPKPSHGRSNTGWKESWLFLVRRGDSKPCPFCGSCPRGQKMVPLS